MSEPAGCGRGPRHNSGGNGAASRVRCSRSGSMTGPAASPAPRVPPLAPGAGPDGTRCVRLWGFRLSARYDDGSRMPAHRAEPRLTGPAEFGGRRVYSTGLSSSPQVHR